MGALDPRGVYGYAEPLAYTRPVRGFEELLDRHRSDLHGFVARRVSDPSLVEDIVQDTLLRAYRARRSFDGHRPVWPWLVTIARNTMSNALRGERSRRRHLDREMDWQSIESHPDFQPAGDPERRYASKVQAAAIAAALDALDDRQRRLLLMRASEGLACEEIARIEHMSLDAVKSLLKRARRAFREAYRSSDDGALSMLLMRWRWRLRSSYRRVRGRLDWIVEYMRCVPGVESAAQALTVAGVAGALILGGLSGHAPRRIAGVRPAGSLASAGTAEPNLGSPSVPTSHVGAEPSVIHKTVGTDTAGQRAAVTLDGALNKHRRHRWETRIHVHYSVPGTSQGIDSDIDVPCAIGVDVCSVTGDPGR